MDKDDVIYVILLLFSIGFGKVIRTIEDVKKKRNLATAVGFLIVLAVSGRHIWHSLCLILVNAFIITSLEKTVIPAVSFAFSFTYLIFFRMTEYIGMSSPSGHSNMVQMILTLKLVGLAFEVKDTHKGITEGRKDPEFEMSKIPNPTIPSIIHYSFCYIGVLTGPYYSYKTYLDMLNLQFSRFTKCSQYAVQRLKMLPFYGFVFVLANYYFPFEYALAEEFYEDRHFMYRLWYSVPIFLQFRMRMYIGMRMSEAVCIMAGAGCYPSFSDPKPGKGPSKEYVQLYNIRNNLKKAQACEYDFKAIHNIEPAGAEFDMTVRNSMKSWNMTVQYWLANYVFKRFPVNSLRLLATFSVSALWHGIYAGYYCTICSVPFYLPIEDIYSRRLKTIQVSSIVSNVWRIFAVCWRLFLMGYWGITFRLLTLEASFKYWKSVYFLPTIFTFVLYGLSFLIFKKRTNNGENTRSSREKGD